jgi:hypothetical protein
MNHVQRPGAGLHPTATCHTHREIGAHDRTKSYHKLGISPWSVLQSKEYEMSLTDRIIAVKPRLPAQ